MVTEQNNQQNKSYLLKRKRPHDQRNRLIIRILLSCLLVGLIIFSITKFATGLLSPSAEHGNTPREISKKIVLDPGHGGEDSPGCEYGGILERELTLELSFLIRDELVKRGYTVVMTRETDKTVTLKQRTKKANRSNADLLISIHLNAFEEPDVSGIETWYNPETNSFNYALAQCIQQATTAVTKGKDRGIYPNTSFVLIREVQIPSCLIEVGYLSNAEERAKLSTEAYREKIAQGIAEGVEQYYESITVDNDSK
jgi:N-acetylmuramoyl-L-alanine amidase